jgi:hypothetical protein
LAKLCWKDRAGSTKNFVAAESIVRVQTALAEVRTAPGEDAHSAVKSIVRVQTAPEGDADADAADVAVLEAGGSLVALTALLPVSVAAAVL